MVRGDATRMFRGRSSDDLGRACTSGPRRRRPRGLSLARLGGGLVAMAGAAV